MLDVRNVSTQYDGLKALSSVSLVAEHEDFVCVLGPNGAGKSTLLQTVAGLLRPVEGEVLFDGMPIQGLPPHQVSTLGISLVPEEGWLYPQMAVEENLLMGAYPRTARRKAQESMALVFNLFPRLKERNHQLAETLSGGERQMLAVGRGLMSRPRLLMLDEPSLGLAPLVIKGILQTLIRINSEEKITILLAEQNIFHALNLSRRGYLLENGRMVLEGASADLLRNEHIKKNYLGL
ncbi:MAG TPA: ABC transporter ATP-binding protein [Desulfatiglandales bacterium]